MIAVRVLVEGRVQGVGFRAFVVEEAEARRLTGWVRNRYDGAVEAVFCGEAAAVEATVEACRRGPRGAIVRELTSSPHPVEPWTAFSVLRTA
jgi:acylphosphatase